jgi:putative endonuclease
MNSSKSEIETIKSSDWLLYILECSDNTLYTGITNRLDTRLQAHQNGTGARYTRGRSPVKLVYLEQCIDRSNATKRESAVKKLSKVQKLKLIASYLTSNVNNSF